MLSSARTRFGWLSMALTLPVRRRSPMSLHTACVDADVW